MRRFALLLSLLPTLGHAAPLCLPEATAVALTQLGTPTEAVKLGRELPVHADGVDLFDLRLWLADHAWGALVMEPNPEAIRQFVTRGWAVVLVRAERGGNHAVVLTAGDEKSVTVMDNRASQPMRSAWPLALKSGHVALVVWRQDRSPEGNFAPTVWGSLRQLDAEFVATGWLRRAEAHKEAGPAKLALLAKAILAAPCFEPARRALTSTLAASTSGMNPVMPVLPVCPSGPKRAAATHHAVRTHVAILPQRRAR